MPGPATPALIIPATSPALAISPPALMPYSHPCGRTSQVSQSRSHSAESGWQGTPRCPAGLGRCSTQCKQKRWTGALIRKVGSLKAQGREKMMGHPHKHMRRPRGHVCAVLILFFSCTYSQRNHATATVRTLHTCPNACSPSTQRLPARTKGRGWQRDTPTSKAQLAAGHISSALVEQVRAHLGRLWSEGKKALQYSQPGLLS